MQNRPFALRVIATLIFTFWLGSYRAEAQGSNDPIDTIKNQVLQQWWPANPRPNVRVSVQLTLDKQGAILGKPNIIGLSGDAAVEVEFALKRASPFLMLDPALYDRWRQTVITFTAADKYGTDVYAGIKMDILGIATNIELDTALKIFSQLKCRISSPQPNTRICELENGNILLIRTTSNLSPNVVTTVVFEFVSGDSFAEVVNSISTQFRTRRSFRETWYLGGAVRMQLTPVTQPETNGLPPIPRWSLRMYDVLLPEKDKAAYEANQKRLAPTPRL